MSSKNNLQPPYKGRVPRGTDLIRLVYLYLADSTDPTLSGETLTLWGVRHFISAEDAREWRLASPQDQDDFILWLSNELAADAERQA